LAAEDIVIYHEDPRAFEALRTELLEQLAPHPGLETMLVERIAAQEWRLRRIPVLEAAALDTFCTNLADAEARWEASRAGHYEETAAEEKKEEEKETTEKEGNEDENLRRSQQLGQAIINDSRDSEVLGKLSRYEAALLSAHARTWEMLLRVQQMRRESEERSPVIDAAATETKTIARFRPKLLKARTE
jgi:hypothetical protein